MNLYLASYAKVTMDKIAKHLDVADFSHKKAIFIPTAGDPYENKDFVDADKRALEKLGCKVDILDIKNIELNSIAEKITSSDILLVAGGDTFYLMDQIMKSGADKVIKDFVEKGGIYIGSSAGSIICCPTIQGAEEFDNPGLAPDLESYKGLSIFPDIIIPHTHKEKYFERVKRATEKLEKQGYRVHHLTDNDVVFYDGVNITKI